MKNNTIKNILLTILALIIIAFLVFGVKQRNNTNADLQYFNNKIDSLQIIYDLKVLEIAYKDSVIKSLLSLDSVYTKHLKTLQHENENLRKIRYGTVPTYYNTLPIQIARDRFLQITNTPE